LRYARWPHRAGQNRRVCHPRPRAGRARRRRHRTPRRLHRRPAQRRRRPHPRCGGAVMGWCIGARLRKSLADVTRRKGRTLLVALGIFIGVFGLTAINTAEDTLFSALNFSLSAMQPDIVLDVDQLEPALLPTLQSVTDVQTVQYQTVFSTQWRVS